MTENIEPYSLDAPAVAYALNVNPALGLSSSQVEERRKDSGPNILQSIRPRPAWRILLDQFASLIVALLGAAAAVAWMTGDVVEAVAILIVLVLNALVGFGTEWQAGRALDALRRQAPATARVRRDGAERSIDAEGLVPGDIIILNGGDRVPADARLLEAAALRAEESSLTGESTTVNKSAEPAKRRDSDRRAPFDALPRHNDRRRPGNCHRDGDWGQHGVGAHWPARGGGA